ncbi:MAG: hypothetical protein AB7V55_06860, partial [Oscillospiraceae bacterium]
MKKLLRGIALVLLPIAVYYGVFLGFTGAVGLNNAIPGASAIEAIGRYRKNPTAGVIIGDSRLAHFNMAQVQATAQVPFTNLAFGGASLAESLDEAEWLLARYPEIDTVVFGLSFYTLNEGYDLGRFETVEKALYNPFATLTNLSFNLELLQNLAIWLGGGVLGGGESETLDPASYIYVDYTAPSGETVSLRQDIVDYLAAIAPYTQHWAPDMQAFERLLALIAQCDEAGIAFVVVLPPMHDAVLDYAVRPAGIEQAMLPLIAQLKASGAQVLDYEFTARPALADSQFFDGFHLDYRRGLP